jgi:hypothetical protein
MKQSVERLEKTLARVAKEQGLAMTPCWWIPAAWAKALAPTMALLGAAPKLMHVASIWLVG